ncbi:MAG: DUF4476 domain-containing protein [Schleiferiaceae bacterium]|nr:DUF4476 domain-containing protein [Schleiferiaceae bacterium]
MKPISLFFCVLFSGLLQAQVPVNFTFFSEEGERFWVILDGVRQNDVPAANVVVEHLTKLSYRAKIIFEDDKIKSISQTVLTRDVDDKPVHTSYIITRRTWTGKVGKKMSMRVSSFEEARPVAVPPSNPQPDQNKSIVPEEEQTPEIPIEAPDFTQQQETAIALLQQATDKAEKLITGGNPEPATKNAEHSQPNRNKRQRQEPQTKKAPCESMSEADFKPALRAIANQSFEDGRLSVARQLISASCISTEQIKEIIALFSFEKTRLDFAKEAWHKTTDPQRYFLLNDSFSFSSSTKELTDYITQQQ